MSATQATAPDAAADSTQAATAQPPMPSTARAWFVVFALSIAAIVSFIDRQVINLMVDPIKADLGISDVQVSLLQGFSFALFYAIISLPLAWVSDRHNRMMVILGGLVCWSAATFFSGFATGFALLFMMRMLVGVGEATLAPAGNSIITDYFPKEKVPAAISVFTGSGFIGSGLALMIGGWLYSYLEAQGPMTLPFGTFVPWQLTFMAVGLLSVPLFFLLLTIREPVRRDDTSLTISDDAPPALEIFAFLKENGRIFFPLIFGFSSFAAAQYGIGAWTPTYFIRIHGWTQLEVGAYFGPVIMFGGLFGVIFGGFLAERWLKKGIVDATVRIPVLAMICTIPFAIAFPLVGSPWLSLALLSVVLFLGTVPFGAGIATFAIITPNRMRAQVMAVYLLIANLVGYSAGPIVIAWLTDNVFASDDAINKSLAIAPVATMTVGLLLVSLALKPYRAMAARQTASET